MNQRHPMRTLLRTAAVLAAIALIGVCFAFARVSALSVRLMLLTLSAVPAAISGFLVYVAITASRLKKGGRNFFLYDRKQRRSITPDQLTPERISQRLLAYMALFRKHDRLYIPSLFDANGGAPEFFKPLFCYQLLGMLSSGADNDALCAFLEGGKELADVFTDYLTRAGEDELCREVQSYIARFDGKDAMGFGEYLKNKGDYLAERMLVYTRLHIHDFD